MEKWQDFARILGTGAPAPLATVTVKNHGTDTLSTIYSDDGVTPKANPTTADATGYVSFYAANGRYDLTIDPVEVAGTATPTYSLGDVLLYDPADA